MKFMTMFFIALLSLFVSGPLSAQTMSLAELQSTLEKEFPTIEKKDIQRRITTLSKELTHTGWHPEILVNASASYQSDVTEVAFAGPAAPKFSKDHYSLSVDLNQTIFEGGRIGNAKKMDELSGQIALANLNVELWQVKAQLEELYFGILLLDQQLIVTETIIEDVARQIDQLKVKVEEGILLPGIVWSLEASQIKNQQNKSDLEAQRRSMISAISILLDMDLEESTNFESPTMIAHQNRDFDYSDRPEFEVLSSNEQLLTQKMESTQSNGLPVVAMFARTAYARPGLNAFEDDMQWYWLAGVKATWKFRDWKNSSREKEIIQYEREHILQEKEILSRSIASELRSIEERIKSLKQKIELDESMLKLRSKIVEEKEALLQEGVITSTEYVTELTAKHLAMINLKLHTTQLLKAEYEYLNKRGTSW